MSFFDSFNLATGGLLMSFLRLSSCDLFWNECYHLPFVGSFSSVKSSNILYVYPLRWNQDPTPRLHCCFLAAPALSPLPPLSLHPLPSPISNCLKGFHVQDPHSALLGFRGDYYYLPCDQWMLIKTCPLSQILHWLFIFKLS